MLSGYLDITKRLEIIFLNIKKGIAKSSYSFCTARPFNGTSEELFQLIRNKYPRAGTNLFTWNPILAYVSFPYCMSPPDQHPKAPKAFNFRKRCRKVVYSLLNFNHLLALEAHNCAAPFSFSKVLWKRFTLISNEIHSKIIIFIHGAWKSWKSEQLYLLYKTDGTERIMNNCTNSKRTLVKSFSTKLFLIFLWWFIILKGRALIRVCFFSLKLDYTKEAFENLLDFNDTFGAQYLTEMCYNNK